MSQNKQESPVAKLVLLADFINGDTQPDGKVKDWAKGVLEKALETDSKPLEVSVGNNLMVTAVKFQCKTLGVAGGTVQIHYVENGRVATIDSDGNVDLLGGCTGDRVLEEMLLSLF